MTTATESISTLFEESFDKMRKASETALQMQQELYGSWAKNWPTLATPKDEWSQRREQFKKEWSGMVVDLMKKQRSLLDEQYQSSSESLEEAFRVAESETPEQLREGCESLCRKALDLMQSTAEKQIKQVQDAMTQWVEVCQVTPSS